jgi:hypothetical protein
MGVVEEEMRRYAPIVVKQAQEAVLQVLAATSKQGHSPMEMETKHFALTEFKADDETRAIEGYASVYDYVDSHKDIVLRGAFDKSLKSKKPVMLWQHRSDQPIGVWDVAEETDKGLLVRGRILDTTMGNDAYKILKAGAIKGLSIGYSTKRYEDDQNRGVRKLLEVELHEVSLVTFPANDRAKVTRVKSLEDVPFEQLHERKSEIEAALRDAGASQSVAKYLASLIPPPARRDIEGEAKAARVLAQLFNQFTA